MISLSAIDVVLVWCVGVVLVRVGIVLPLAQWGKLYGCLCLTTWGGLPDPRNLPLPRRPCFCLCVSYALLTRCLRVAYAKFVGGFPELCHHGGVSLWSTTLGRYSADAYTHEHVHTQRHAQHANMHTHKHEQQANMQQHWRANALTKKLTERTYACLRNTICAVNSEHVKNRFLPPLI